MDRAIRMSSKYRCSYWHWILTAWDKSKMSVSSLQTMHSRPWAVWKGTGCA